MYKYVKASRYSVDKLGPRQKKEFVRLIKRYNAMDIDEPLYTTVTLGRFLDNYFRANGLVYFEDFANPPFQENVIVKFSDKTVPEFLEG